VEALAVTSERPVKLASVVSIMLLWLGGQAFAADLPLPGPPPRTSYVPATASFNNWGGGYLGLNGGYAFGHSEWSFAGVSTGSFTTNGALFGGQLGANFQFNRWLVFGFEADFDGSGVDGGSSVAGCAAIGAPAGSACRTKNDWLSTVRARGGYAFGNVLLYATGGLAIGNVELALTQPGVTVASVQAGWTAGGGVEYAFSDMWTVKAEYLFVDFGRIGCGFTTLICGGGSVRLTENIIRGGFNWKFSW
jgi:outer membrane immunogenic protein